MKFKRLFSGFLALVLAIGMVPGEAFGFENSSDGFTFPDTMQPTEVEYVMRNGKPANYTSNALGGSAYFHTFNVDIGGISAPAMCFDHDKNMRGEIANDDVDWTIDSNFNDSEIIGALPFLATYYKSKELHDKMDAEHEGLTEGEKQDIDPAYLSTWSLQIVNAIAQSALWLSQAGKIDGTILERDSAGNPTPAALAQIQIMATERNDVLTFFGFGGGDNEAWVKLITDSYIKGLYPEIFCAVYNQPDGKVAGEAFGFAKTSIL